ncbi:MAG: hypothetical protein ACE1ZQ_02800 [Ignavibacteriaceae bacterium]
MNALLDWRNRLNDLKKTGEYPKEWYDREIRATDYLMLKKIDETII